MCQQQRDLREYTQATIYVHKVVDNKKVPVPLVVVPSNDQACLLTCCWIFTEDGLGLPYFCFLVGGDCAGGAIGLELKRNSYVIYVDLVSYESKHKY